MTSFYYYDQNPSGFCFLVQIRAFVIQTSLGLQNLNMKGKTKRILFVLVKLRHRANGLLVVSFEHGFLKHVIRMLSNIDRRLNLGFRLPAGAL